MTDPQTPATEAGRLLWRVVSDETIRAAIIAIEAEAAIAAVTHCADLEHAAQERVRDSVSDCRCLCYGCLAASHDHE